MACRVKPGGGDLKARPLDETHAWDGPAAVLTKENPQRFRDSQTLTITALDTDEVVKELKAAGFTGSQAEVVTRLLRQVQDIVVSTLVTKTDLAVAQAALQAALKAEAAETKAELTAKILENKAEILKWMIGTIGLQTVAILSAVVALLRLMPR